MFINDLENVPKVFAKKGPLVDLFGKLLKTRSAGMAKALRTSL